MANFTYANSAVVSRMFEHLQNTSFQGITVSESVLDTRQFLMEKICAILSSWLT